MEAKGRNRSEELQQALNPHRKEQERTVAIETADRLRGRGIAVRASDSGVDLADLLTAVEQFEALVEMRGGDLMVDDLKSSEPDDVHFVLPTRKPRESVRSYIARVQDVTGGVHRHPPHID